MSSKSKRRHANKGYNRANNKPPVVDTEKNAAIPQGSAQELSATPVMTDLILTPKQLKERAKEQQKQQKEAIKAAKLKDKTKKKNKQEKKDDVKRGPFRWIGEVGSELKKVQWPSFKQTLKATGVVLGIVVVFSLIIFGMDRLLGWLYDMLIS